MDAYGTARLAARDAESAIVARICEDFNMTPVLARAHFEHVARYFSDFGQMALQPGELCYLAVAAEEPPGKPIMACRKMRVALELATSEDHDVLRVEGLAAMRQQRLARLARQAQVQGGLLTVEVLAYLMCSSTATVKRDLAECRGKEIAVPTGVRSGTLDRGWCSCTCGGCIHRDRTAHSPFRGCHPLLSGGLPSDRRALRPGCVDSGDPGRDRTLGVGDR